MKLLKFLFTFINLIIVVSAQNSCYTPNGELARCIALYNCPILVNSVQYQNPERVRFLRESKCGYTNVPLVCCGSAGQYTEITTPRSRNQQYPLDPFRNSLRNQQFLETNRNSDIKLHRNFNLLPSGQNCGQQGLIDKIFGGNETSLGEFPWVAMLEYRRNGNSVGFNCGGALINEKYVLTAAHCVVGAINRIIGSLFRVRLGEHNIQTQIDCQRYEEDNEIYEECNEPPQDLEVEEAIVHPSYNDASRDKYNDIALIRLRRRAQITEFVRPICLPVNGERTMPGQNMSVTGWGRTETGGRSNVKLKALVPYMDDQQCRSIFLSAARLTSTQFCAGGVQGIDSCEGDSGGPIMNISPNGGWYSEGIVSFGSRFCGSTGVPGVYTKVSSYLNWIVDTIKP